MNIPLDLLDIKILEVLYETTNLSDVARRVGVSEETVRRRIHKLYCLGRITAEPDFTALGLTYALYITKAFNEEVINILGDAYLLSACRLITSKGLFTFLALTPPIELEDKIQIILEKTLGPGRYIAARNPIKWKPSTKFFDPTHNEFTYDWNKLLQILLNQDNDKSELSTNGAKWYRNPRLDKLDLIILKLLHQDALTPLSTIAKIANTYPQLVWYHYKRHVKPLIRFNMINMVFIPTAEVPLTLHEVTFSSYSLAKRFAIMGRLNPFFKVIFPNRYKPSLIIIAQLPSKHMLQFMKIIAELVDHEIIIKHDILGMVNPNYMRAFTTPNEKLHVAGRWILKENVIKKIGKIIGKQYLVK